MKLINDIFDNMDKWRHLPAYQLERRADIFFSIYLTDILAHRFGVDIEGVIPEFPIRVGTIHHNTDINKSFKIDYLAKSNSNNKIFFVELKTDQASRRDKQDWYLERAREVGLTELLVGIRKIYKATKSKNKYQHLLALLHKMGFIIIDSNGSFEITQANYDIQIVYIQPNNPDDKANVITFQEVSEFIEGYGDDLSIRFSRSLLNWAEKRAGDQ
jgi:hypothetical protein